MASGSVDLEGTKPVAPPPIRQMKPAHVMAAPQAIPAGSTVRIAQGGQVQISLNSSDICFR